MKPAPGLTRSSPEGRANEHGSLAEENARLRAEIERLEEERESLRQSERFLDSLIETIPNMIFVKDARELRFVRFNRAGEQLLGYPREQLIGKNDFDLFPPKEAEFFIQKDRSVLLSNTILDIPEEVLHTSRGETRFLHTRKITVANERGEPEYLLGISEDITERKKAEMERDESREHASRLEEQRRLRESFVAALSHDLRSPLTAAKSSAEMILRNNDALTTPKFAIRIVQSIDRADRMIRDLLDANRIRAGQKIALKIGENDIREILQEVCEEIRCVHGDRLLLEIEADEVRGHWSADELRRAIENLLTNALKYGDPRLPVAIKAYRDDDHAVISVHNWSNPIPPHEMENLFKPFSRSESALTSGQRGWGLGLTLVRGVMEAHGGRVLVESSQEKGTTFSLRFPIDARPLATESTGP